MRIDYQQLEFVDKKLRLIVKDLEREFRVEFEITSLFRIGDEGVHGQIPLRGTDLGCKNFDIGQAVEKYVNKTWSYDSTRPLKECCLFHDSGEGYHLHLQSHLLTRKR